MLADLHTQTHRLELILRLRAFPFLRNHHRESKGYATLTR